MGHLRVTIGFLRVTVGHLRVTLGHLRLPVGYLKATLVHIRVTLGHLKVTIGYFFSISKHKANTTELHPKVRQTCLYYTLQKVKGSPCSTPMPILLTRGWIGL